MILGNHNRRSLVSRVRHVLPGWPTRVFATALLLAATLVQTGCVGLTGASSPGDLAFSPTKVDFGEVAAGSKKTVTVTLTNSGSAPLTLPQATIAGASYSMSGLTLPATLAPNDVLTFSASFAPTVSGTSSGAIVVSSGDPSVSPPSLALTGTGLNTSGPTILTEPASQSVTIGQTANFAVTATGTGTLGYQWKKNGATISGATAANYTTPAAVASDSGAQFTVVVTDSVGTATSGAATLAVTATPLAPSIATQPSNATVTAGQTATFSVTASGTSPLSYQWRKNGANVSGATASTYTTPATTSADSGVQFSVVVTNAAGSVTSSAATLTVNTPVTITSQPASQTVTAGQTATFSVSVSGAFSTTYQWRKNGVNISGGTAASYATPVTTTADSGAQFSVVITSLVGSVTSNSATLTVTAAPVAPSITTQPSSRTVTAGQTATFSVTASGTSPLSYQWRKNGVSIGGATASSYTTPATTAADNGALFSVVVTNSLGSATSSAATLTVNTPVSITSQPASQTVTAGQTATFSITATGTAPLSYQWTKNGANISGATGPAYTTPATVIGDSGAQFTVVVSNPAGSVTSSTATLTVTATPVAPSITTQPASQTIATGQTATFSVTASGTAPLSYQWSKNGASIGGAVAASYTTAATTAADNGALYSVVVSNSLGSIFSSNATLTVNDPPAITSQPVGPTVLVGQTASFSVTSTGAAPLSYQWRKNGTNIGGATAANYTTPATTAADSGAQYSVVVSNSVASVASNAVTLTVNAAPAITTQPASRTVTAGQAATFSVTASGTAPLSYQWRKNGANIGGATAASYTTPATIAADDGSLFSVVVTNSIGSATSSDATLTVTTPVSISSQPVGATVTAGQTATFLVSATGTGPLSYQWRKNGANITGATASSYTTPATTNADNGAQYSVVVTNTAGNVTSSTVTLTVDTAPSITTQPASRTVVAGQTATFSVTASGTAPLSYQWQKNGANINGATAASYTTPATTTADTGAQFTVVVTNPVGNATSNAAALTVNAATLLLTANPTSLSFGSVNVSSNKMLSVTISNTGNSSVTIASVSQSGPGFSASGASSGLIIAAGQTATLNVTFAPSGAGSATGNVSVTSNATDSPASIGLTGSGAVQHTVTLTWNASTSTVTGYYAYRGTISGGPYTKLSTSATGSTTFTDSTVQSGSTYFYVVTAVDSAGVESNDSNAVSASIP